MEFQKKNLKQAHFIWAPLAVVSVFSVVFSVVASAAPKETRYRDTTLEIQAGDRLVVSGIRATVRLNAPTSGSKVPILRARKVLPDKASAANQAKFEAMSIGVRREPGALILEARGPAGKDIADWLKPNGPEMILEIEASAIPTEIALHSGTVQAQGWKGPLAIQMVDGAIKTNGTEGALTIQVQKGDVKVDTHRGRVDIEGYGPKVTAQNVDGDLRLDNFGGESSVSQIKGNLQLRTRAGGTSITNSTGSLDFDLGRGGLTIQEFDGALRGQTENAAVNATVEGDADVNIESNQGAVSLRLPAGSGAAVRLQTETGVLGAPESIRTGESGAVKTAVGRLAGSGAKGSVAIRSKGGAIRVR